MMTLENGKPPTAGKQNGGFGQDAGDARNRPNYPDASPSTQALQVIEGEAYATAFLARLQAQQARAEELTTLVQFLDGAMLHGACRVLFKALEGKHHA